MPVLTDLTTELETYLDTYVTCELVELDIPGDALNVLEVVRFRVEVRNTGPLILHDVQLRLVGRNGTLVKSNGAIDDFGPDAVQSMAEVAAHNGNEPQTSAICQFTAPAGPKPTGTDLVEVYIDDYTAVLDHMLVGHSRASTTARGLYESKVRSA